MVIKWSLIAEERLKAIFDYFFDVASYKTAFKIVSEIINTVDLLSSMPLIAPIEPILENEKETFRSLVIKRHYKVIYFIEENNVNIVDVWDCRQDPEILKERVLFEN